MTSRRLCRLYDRAVRRLRRRATRLHAIRLAGGDVAAAYALYWQAYALCHALWRRTHPAFAEAEAVRVAVQGRQLALSEIGDAAE